MVVPEFIPGLADHWWQEGEGGWEFLAVQWLGLRILFAEGLHPIPGKETKIPRASCYSKRKGGRWRVMWRGRGGAGEEEALCNLLTVTNNPKVVELGLNPMPELQVFSIVSPFCVIP